MLGLIIPNQKRPSPCTTSTGLLARFPWDFSRDRLSLSATSAPCGFDRSLAKTGFTWATGRKVASWDSVTRIIPSSHATSTKRSSIEASKEGMGKAKRTAPFLNVFFLIPNPDLSRKSQHASKFLNELKAARPSVRRPKVDAVPL